MMNLKFACYDAELAKIPFLPSYELVGINKVSEMPNGLPEGQEDLAEFCRQSFSERPQDERPSNTFRRTSNEWSAAEDELLNQLVSTQESPDWGKVARQLAECLPGCQRSSNQCYQRWMRVVNPAIKKGKWTQEEDMRLVNAMLSSPPRRWGVIANKLGGRTDTQVRYRIMAIGKQLMEKRLIGEQYLAI